MLSSFLSQIKGKSLKSSLIRGGFASVCIKILGLGLSMLTVVFLARVLGPEQFGIYTYVLAIVSICAIPAMFGLPSLIVRETAKAEIKQEWSRMRGLWFWSNGITTTLSIAIALIVAAILWLHRDNFTQNQLLTFAWGIVFIPLSALAGVRAASLRGLRKVIQGQLPEHVLKPALFIIMLVFVGLAGLPSLTAQSAMMLNALSAGGAFIFGAWLLWRARPNQLVNAKKEFESKTWITSVIPLAMISGLDILLKQTDIVLLGLLTTNENVGFYRIAIQVALLLSIVREAVKMIIMPYLVRFYQEDNINSFQRLVTQSTRVGFLFSLCPLILIIILGKSLIELVFGIEYVLAYYALVFLCLAQVIDAFFGMAGTLLTMCGYERKTLTVQVITIFFNIAFNLLLIPLYGMEGAAIATLFAIIIRKILIWVFAYKYLRVDSSVLGLKIAL